MSSKLLNQAQAAPFPWHQLADAEHPAAGAPEMSGYEENATAGKAAERELDATPYLSRIAALEQELAACKSRVPVERKAGYEEGYAKGQAEGEARFKAAQQRMAESVERLAACRPGMRREVESDAVRLSLAIARKVLRRELHVDPEAIAGLLRVAFDKANARDMLRVRVAPADVNVLRARMTGMPHRVEVVADPALEAGSLVLETSQGQIDASVHAQLEEIERGLADALDRNGGGA